MSDSMESDIFLINSNIELICNHKRTSFIPACIDDVVSKPQTILCVILSTILKAEIVDDWLKMTNVGLGMSDPLA